MDQLRYSQDLELARKQARRNIPICPGVYGWLDAQGCLLYVGKSKSLRHRLSSYFSASPSDPKMERIRREADRVVWESISHELLALIREQELIDRLRPPMNVQGKPERRQPGFVCLSKGSAPTAFFAGQIPARAAKSFGPVAGTGQLREAITSLNYVFQLRDCPDKVRMRFGDQLRLFTDDISAQCLRFELSTCGAPCAAACTRESYRQNVDAVAAFLQGDDDSVLEGLKRKMIASAADLAFERAGVVRDQLSHLTWLHRRLGLLAKSRLKLNGVAELAGFDHRKIWLVLNQGNLDACLTRPTTEMTHQKQGPPVQDTRLLVESGRANHPRTSLEVNLLLLLVSWLKKNPCFPSCIMSRSQAARLSSTPERVKKLCA